MFKVKYVDSIMMLVRLDLNLIVSLFQHKCEVSEKVSTTTLLSSSMKLAREEISYLLALLTFVLNNLPVTGHTALFHAHLRVDDHAVRVPYEVWAPGTAGCRPGRGDRRRRRWDPAAGISVRPSGWDSPSVSAYAGAWWYGKCAGFCGRCWSRTGRGAPWTNSLGWAAGPKRC